MASMTGWPTDADEGSVANEARWRAMARLWAPSGVISGYLNELAPTLAAGPIINVAAGAAWVDGHYTELGSPASEAVTANGTLVVRFTAASNLFELVWRDGVDRFSITQTTAVWELPIADMQTGTMRDMRLLMGPNQLQPSARFTRTTDEIVPNTTWTPIQGPSAADLTTVFNHDQGLFRQVSGSIVLQRPAVCTVTAGASFATNSNGYRAIRLYHNDITASIASAFSSSSTVDIHLNVTSGPYSFPLAGNIRADVYQNSGGNLSLSVANMVPFISITRVG